jgi:hypothetical protein
VVHAYVEPGALYRYVPVYFSDYVRSPPPYKSARISPPPRTNRTRISPPPRTNRTHRRGAQGAAYVRAPGQVTERLRSLGVVEKPWAPTPSPWNLC